VYLYALNGVRGQGFLKLKKDYSQTQLWRLEQQDSDGSIQPVFVLERRKSLGSYSAKDPSFRWAGGAYVTSAGFLTVTAMLRKKRGIGAELHIVETYVPKCYIPSSVSGVCGIVAKTSQIGAKPRKTNAISNWSRKERRTRDARTQFSSYSSDGVGDQPSA